MIDRAIKRRKPCTEKGEEIRDAVLWLTVLDIAEASKDRVIFVSRNTKQFADSRGSLHEDLEKEYNSRGLNLTYYSSLDEFAKQHASRIDFITEGWLVEKLPIDSIIDLCASSIEGFAEKKGERDYFFGRERPTGYYSYVGGYLEVDEFFVYEMTDGTYRVEAMIVGIADVEYEVEDTDSYYNEGRPFGSSAKMRNMGLDIGVTLEAVVVGEKWLNGL